MAAKDSALIDALRRAGALGALLLAGACAAPPPYRMPPPAAEPVPVAPPHVTPLPPVQEPVKTPPEPPKPVAKEAPEPPSREYRLGPAAQSLVNQARQQIAKGLHPAASATLDRALRIEPQNPLLWIEVARLRLAEGDLQQAERCARRALLLGSTDASVRLDAGHLLADVLRGLHRDDEARDLEDQPWMK